MQTTHITCNERVARTQTCGDPGVENVFCNIQTTHITCNERAARTQTCGDPGVENAFCNIQTTHITCNERPEVLTLPENKQTNKHTLDRFHARGRNSREATQHNFANKCYLNIFGT